LASNATAVEPHENEDLSDTVLVSVHDSSEEDESPWRAILVPKRLNFDAKSAGSDGDESDSGWSVGMDFDNMDSSS